MDLSIVTALYYSAALVEEFHRRATAAARQIADSYEIILVNDGCPDGALDVALLLYERDEHVRIVDLSRNFGQHKAMMTGLACARGDRVFLLDSDLEEAPEFLPLLRAEMERTGADVVYGVRARRYGRWDERITGELFYRLFALLSDHPVPRNVLNARLMTRRYVAQLIEHRDQEVFILGLFAMTGFHQVPLVLEKTAKGKSTYTFRRKIAMFVNSVTSFSNKPLILIFYLGSFISAVAGLLALYLTLRWLFVRAFRSVAPLLVSIWLLGGLMIFCLGVVGIYMSKIFTEKRRPHVVRRLYEHPAATTATRPQAG